MNKVAVVQGLEAEIAKLQVALWVQCTAQRLKIKVQQFRGNQLELNTAGDECLKGGSVMYRHITLCRFVGDTEEA